MVVVAGATLPGTLGTLASALHAPTSAGFIAAECIYVCQLTAVMTDKLTGGAERVVEVSINEYILYYGLLLREVLVLLCISSEASHFNL